jgi:hypothetical protein
MNNKSIALLIVIVISIELFRFNAIKESIFAVFDTLTLIYLFNFINKKSTTRFAIAKVPVVKIKKNFKTGIKWFVWGVVISFIPAWIFHDQSIIYSYAVCRFFGYVLIYFYLHKRNYKVRDVENVVIVAALMFQVITILETKFQSGSPLFGEYYSELSSGITRLIIYGRHLLMLSFCILLTRFKFNAKIMGLIMFALLIIMLLQTRQLLLPTVIILIVHFRKIIFKSFFAGISIVILVSIGLYFSGDIFDKVINKTISQSNDNRLGGDRLQSYIYYLKDDGSNFITRVFGDGFPAPTTAYGDQFKAFRTDSGLSPSDIGPVGFVTYYGFIWLIGMIIMIWKSIKLKVPPRYVYVKYFMFIVLFTLPVGENQFVSSSSIVTLMLTFYIIDKGNAELLEEKKLAQLKRTQRAQLVPVPQI